MTLPTTYLTGEGFVDVNSSGQEVTPPPAQTTAFHAAIVAAHNASPPGSGGGIFGFIDHPGSSIGHLFRDPSSALFHGPGSAWHGIAANPVLDVLVVADVLSYGALSSELGAYAGATDVAANAVLPYAEAATAGTYLGGAAGGANSLESEVRTGPNSTEYRLGAEFAVSYGLGQVVGAAAGSSVWDVGSSIAKGFAVVQAIDSITGKNLFAGPGAYTPGENVATQNAQQILADISGKGYSNQAQIAQEIAQQQADASGASAPSGSGNPAGGTGTSPGGGPSMVGVLVIAAGVILLIRGAS